MSAPVESVADFRTRYRATEIGPRYSGWAHFAFTTLVSLAIIVAALAGVRAPTAAELATVPLAFLFSNLGEYLGHKGPMHHRRPGFGFVFKRHTLQHHQFFTDEAMSYESARDFKMVLFPWYMVLFFFGLMALPVGLLAWLVTNANVGRLFVATTVGYFLTYEWLHFAYHLPPDTRIGKLALVGVLRRHHQAHHTPARMTTHNFNVTFPICDALFGTLWRD
jgi:hypothetical protein